IVLAGPVRPRDRVACRCRPWRYSSGGREAHGIDLSAIGVERYRRGHQREFETRAVAQPEMVRAASSFRGWHIDRRDHLALREIRLVMRRVTGQTMELPQSRRAPRIIGGT